MPAYDFALSLALGLGLAAAVGLRVFLPMLIVSAAAWSGQLSLAPGFEWLATAPALLALGSAALLEVAAYYVPGLDHLLDVLAAPVAVLAGSVLAAAVMVDVPPLVRWTMAVILGGGAAGLTQGLTALLRLKSAALTGGLANPLVASGELTGAAVLTLLTLAAPLLGLALLVLGCVWVVRRLRSRRAPPATG
ncbi:MAG: DUF4126 domain-containing protein [Gammaproteobacteria bacterium]|nr:DUF4126 domain-containing protein [Gammaproteobacteria bacterium]